MKISKPKRTVINTLQLEHLIQTDPLAKGYFTAVNAQDQFLTRVGGEIKKTRALYRASTGS